MGRIARFRSVESRLFHSFEAERISDALSNAIRHTTVIMLTSDTPVRENALTIADVVLNALVVLKTLLAVVIVLTALVVLIALVALIVLDSVLSIDDNNFYALLSYNSPVM